MHLLDINEIAKKAGIPAEYVEPYGKLKAKVDMKYFDEIKHRPDGKLVLVTAITPTKAGEGKTTNRLKGFCRQKRIILYALTLISIKYLGYSTYFMYFCIAVP